MSCLRNILIGTDSGVRFGIGASSRLKDAEPKIGRLMAGYP